MNPDVTNPAARVIMIVEDEPTIADILASYLRHTGFAPVLMTNGQEALAAIRRSPPDLVLLDVMLPGLDGTEVCRAVRTFSAVPIIMVTARVDEIDRLLGLEVGADDYVCKPFSPREVVARVQTVLRRAGRSSEIAPAPVPWLEIDDDAARITLNGQRLDLTPTEFRLLRLLASRPGRVYSRGQILDLAYLQDQDVSDRIIDSHVKNIRKKIAAILPEVEVIHSVYGIGYRYEA
ncbi:DNA-binding response regulator in two-component regulatory system with BaeS [Candidatus Terasakiella magnetica]|nr:DNA-binding response regulator in two-component regulatory system with BaeS [Candidatus Terasakiella magnetica]